MRNHFLRAVQKTTQFDPLSLFVGGKNGAWFDASDLTTMFQDTAGTIPVTTDGQKVALWKDKSGNNFHVSNSTTSQQPVYKTDGTKAWLEFVQTSSQSLFYTGTNVGVANAFMAFRPSSGVPSFVGYLTNRTDQGVLVDYIFTASGSQAAWDLSLGQGNGIGNTYRNNQTASFTYSYGTDQVVSANTSLTSYASFFPTGIRIGGDRSNFGRFMTGRIYGVIIVGASTSEILSTTLRDQTESWLSSKTVSVPF
jgi:hypothetical protein